MESNRDKILQRQRICRKCSSFVTFEKGDEGQYVCPLCNHKLEPSVNKLKPMHIDQARKAIEKQIREQYGLAYKDVKKKEKPEESTGSAEEKVEASTEEVAEDTKTDEEVEAAV